MRLFGRGDRWGGKNCNFHESVWDQPGFADLEKRKIVPGWAGFVKYSCRR